jgi:hypothetical protein
MEVNMALAKKDYLQSVAIMLEPDGRIAHVVLEHGYVVTEDDKHLTRGYGERQILTHEQTNALVVPFLAKMKEISIADFERKVREQKEAEKAQEEHAKAEQAERDRVNEIRAKAARPQVKTKNEDDEADEADEKAIT